MGLPNETIQDWNNSLDQLIVKKPGHLSTYFLTIEQSTPFHDRLKYQEGIKPLPSINELEQIYQENCDKIAKHGYEHYEICSYAKNKSYRGIHNSVYWRGDVPFFGFGMGAASFLNQQRLTRPNSLKGYLNWVENLKKSEGLILFQEGNQNSILEGIGSFEWLKSIVMGRLRTIDGLDIDEISKLIKIEPMLFKKRINEFILPYEEMGLINKSIKGNIFSFNPKKGFLLSDEITSRLFLFLEELFDSQNR